MTRKQIQLREQEQGKHGPKRTVQLPPKIGRGAARVGLVFTLCTEIYIYIYILYYLLINRPGVAGAVLQTGS